MNIAYFPQTAILTIYDVVWLLNCWKQKNVESEQ